jgi:NTE family protein
VSEIAADAAPVHDAGAQDPEPPADTVALCLSGGGYRAMLYHVGALWRLNELGWLPRLTIVSSVSGGSITAGALALHWSRLAFDPATGVASAAGFQDAVVTPLRGLAGQTIDVGAGLRGLLTPKTTISDRVAVAYRKHLFGDATLQDLPDERTAPRFVINATNLLTGVLFRFTRSFMADYTIGLQLDPRVPLAQAVAASSAFPPVLSPAHLQLDPNAWATNGRGPNHHPPFTSRAVLSDGGVYDNLGLEAAWKNAATVLISDGGGQMGTVEDVGADWVHQGLRVNAVIDNQVRALRRRNARAGFARGDRKGTFWRIRTNVDHYGPPPSALPTPYAATLRLAAVKTRLAALDATTQERLINWGYASCDVAMRRWVEPTASPPSAFPYPSAGVGA